MSLVLCNSNMKKQGLISFYETHPSLLVYPNCRSGAPLWSDLLDWHLLLHRFNISSFVAVLPNTMIIKQVTTSNTPKGPLTSFHNTTAT